MSTAQQGRYVVFETYWDRARGPQSLIGDELPADAEIKNHAEVHGTTRQTRQWVVAKFVTYLDAKRFIEQRLEDGDDTPTRVRTLREAAELLDDVTHLDLYGWSM